MRCELCHTDNARLDGRCGPDCPRHASALLDAREMDRPAAREPSPFRLKGPRERHLLGRAQKDRRHA